MVAANISVVEIRVPGVIPIQVDGFRTAQVADVIHRNFFMVGDKPDIGKRAAVTLLQRRGDGNC